MATTAAGGAAAIEVCPFFFFSFIIMVPWDCFSDQIVPLTGYSHPKIDV